VLRIGRYSRHYEPDAWRALSSSIIGQQVSTHAARAIRARFAAIIPDKDFPSPADVLSTADEMLRGAGLSQNKMLSNRDLARHFEEGLINTRRFPRMSDEEIIQALVPVRGIGRWTAEMFLIFSLGRPDVLAVDDLGLRNAIKRLYGWKCCPRVLRCSKLPSRGGLSAASRRGICGVHWTTSRRSKVNLLLCDGQTMHADRGNDGTEQRPRAVSEDVDAMHILPRIS
jgi:DNA-3-methyladenine glycosylase II